MWIEDSNFPGDVLASRCRLPTGTCEPESRRCEPCAPLVWKCEPWPTEVKEEEEGEEDMSSTRGAVAVGGGWGGGGYSARDGSGGGGGWAAAMRAARVEGDSGTKWSMAVCACVCVCVSHVFCFVKEEDLGVREDFVRIFSTSYDQINRASAGKRATTTTRRRGRLRADI